MSISTISFSSRNSFKVTPAEVKQTQIQPSIKGNSQSIPLYLNYIGNLNKAQMVSFKGASLDTALDERFKQFRPFAPDEKQQEVIDALREGKNVIYAAPTGTGKTFTAEHIMLDNLKKFKAGDKNAVTVYTAPLKALSNDKLRELNQLFGEENIGIITGDTQDNEKAAQKPIIIMTTEIYRNILTNNQGKKSDKTESKTSHIGDKLDNIKTIVFDEFHYMNDPERGTTWEESIMFSPKEKQLLILTGTIGNPEPVAKWIDDIRGIQNTTVVKADKRNVPLEYLVFTPGSNKLEALDSIESEKLQTSDPRDKKAKKKEKAKLAREAKMQRKKAAKANKAHAREKTGAKHANNTQSYEKVLNGSKVSEENMPVQSQMGELVKILKKEDKLPAIIFKFSKFGCEQLKKNTIKYIRANKEFEVKDKPENPNFYFQKNSLLTAKEQEKLVKEVREYRKDHPYIGETFNTEDLKTGVAVHTAGLLPVQKELIEKLFKEKLIKVVFATETLSAGINMPARTTVITAVEKMTSQGKRELTTNEFQQMAGRAGRRGIDTRGYVITVNNGRGEVEFAQEKSIAPADDIVSNFKPSYGLVASLLKTNPASIFDEIIEKSFATRDGKSSESPKRNKEALSAQFNNMTNFLEEKGFIEKWNDKGDYEPHDKALMASQFKGVNEVLITELITKGAFKGLNPAQLAAVTSSLIEYRGQDKVDKKQKSDKKDEKKHKKEIKEQPQQAEPLLSGESIEKTLKKVEIFEKEAGELRIDQKRHGIDKEFAPALINKSIVPYVQMWADPTLLDEKEQDDPWQSITKKMEKTQLIQTEGDFFKIINSTADLLNQIRKNTAKSDKELSETALEALALIMKPPVLEDIAEETKTEVLAPKELLKQE